MKHKVSLEWDGDLLKEKIDMPERKISPREILDSLNHVQTQISHMEGQKEQLQKQVKAVEADLSSAREFLKDRARFRERATELQLSKLNELINKIHKECKKKAEEDAAIEIARDPHAMTDNQKENLAYVKYQRNLATHPKVAKHISPQIIKEHLFEEPVFENPFN